MRALAVNYPEFAEELRTSGEHGVSYRCIVDGDQIPVDGLAWPMSREFSITPIVHGGGKVLGTILGAALLIGAIALAPATGGLSAHIAGAGLFGGITYGTVALFGAALLLGGVSQMLTPTPQAQSGTANNENPYFNGPVNVTSQGGAVPIGYGRAIVGSVVISAGITVEQPEPTPAAIGGFTPGWY